MEKEQEEREGQNFLIFAALLVPSSYRPFLSIFAPIHPLPSPPLGQTLSEIPPLFHWRKESFLAGGARRREEVRKKRVPCL